MKFVTPEISWHGREPIYSVDVQTQKDGISKLATCGADKFVRIWSLSRNANHTPKIEFLSVLSRHQRTVNVVRFSPDGQFLASGADDFWVILWKLDDSFTFVPLFGEEEEEECKERWNVSKVFRNHLESVIDISWSADSQRLVSGSQDNSAIVWDVKKGCKLWIFNEHQNFVQGVSFDPLDKFMATMSSDRSLRVYQQSNNSLLHEVSKLSSASKPFRMFHDDTLSKSFFRRLSFSPDGKLLVVPSGCLELDSNELLSTTFIFWRDNLTRPIAHLPLPPSCKTSLIVRFCPKLFKAWDVQKDDDKELLFGGAETMFKIPYRMVFAIIAGNSVILYDTQFTTPIAYLSNIHYHSLSDIAWSDDGSFLIVSSTDGYCTLIGFEQGELGEPYESEIPLIVEPSQEPVVIDGVDDHVVEMIVDPVIEMIVEPVVEMIVDPVIEMTVDPVIDPIVVTEVKENLEKPEPPPSNSEDVLPDENKTKAKKPRRVAVTTLCTN